MRRPAIHGLATLLALFSAPALAAAVQAPSDGLSPVDDVPAIVESGLEDLEKSLPPEYLVRAHSEARAEADFRAMSRFRPGYSFWQHIFTIPDGSVAYGSGRDGRLLVTFPNQGDWTQNGDWADGAMVGLLEGTRLERRLSRRRDQVAELLEPAVGPVLHNPTRGRFLLPNADRYGGFLDEWATIYERFGVPAEIGLAQAIVESGLNGKIKSEARAIGFCQWLPRNWQRLEKQASSVIEVQNQTTQAPYCAAYLTVLATKYGTFIPALSEHHSGGANVGRTVINGERLGGTTMREQYLLGSQFARDVRQISVREFRDIVHTYGPRSFLYTEMVFGNTFNVRNLREGTPQEQIFAMRVPRTTPLSEVTRVTGLSVDEVHRFNPALIHKVPKGANLYLPFYVESFGPDVSFWHRPPDPRFEEVLSEFLSMETNPDQWDSPTFQPVLKRFQERFRETETEEGDIMATALGYALQETGTNHRVLTRYRASPQIRRVFLRAVERREAALAAASSQR